MENQSLLNQIILILSLYPRTQLVLHVGHCRGAIFGDVLSNFLKFYGHNVIKEYYINDYGNQIYLFVNLFI